MGMRVRTDHDARQRGSSSLARWLLVLGLLLGLIGGTTAVSVAGTAAASPVYVQVARAGTTYTTYTSGEGVTWSPLAGSSVVMTMTMTGTALGGLAVAANSTSALSTAQFDAVTLVTQTATTLGNAQVGASQDSYDSSNMDGSKVTTGPRGARITSMTAYVGAIDPTAANDRFQTAIYADSNGSPPAWRGCYDRSNSAGITVERD